MILDRRRFLQSAAIVAGGSALGRAVDPVPASALSRPGGGALDSLSKALKGRLLRPGDDGYAVAAWPNAGRWADVHPRAVALCTGPDDVRACVEWLQEQKGPSRDFAVRSGGHNYAGFSTTNGLLIDVKPMNRITIDRGTRTAVVEAGASNQDLADALRGAGFAVPSGRCPTVGTSGLVLGGGWGFSATRHGLTCDSLRSTEVVTADGRLRRAADARDLDPDLFWAARGGGGGNFGVHTSFTFDLYDVKNVDVTVFNIVWPATRQVEIVLALQQIQAENAKTLSTRTKIAPSKVGVPTRDDLAVQTFGQFWGPPDQFRAAMAKAISIADPAILEVNGMSYWSARDYLVTDDPLGLYDLRSRYVKGGLSGDAVDTMLTQMTRWPGGSLRQDNMGILFAVGGKVKEKRPEDTAYVHRQADYIFEMETTWSPLDTPAVVARQKEWLAGYFDAMERHVMQQSYVNFPSRSLPDWQRAYYGDNLGRLSQVKLQYDPHEFFRFPQSVPLPTRVSARG